MQTPCNSENEFASTFADQAETVSTISDGFLGFEILNYIVDDAIDQDTIN